MDKGLEMIEEVYIISKWIEGDTAPSHILEILHLPFTSSFNAREFVKEKNKEQGKTWIFYRLEGVEIK